MARPRHPNKDIEAAIWEAESLGWRILHKGNPIFGELFCPFNDKTCRGGDYCRRSVNNTPKNPANHARNLIQHVRKCLRLLEKQNPTDGG
jgi:hypothetical protein